MLMGAENDRYNDLGNKIMCSCGCEQILLKCNHVGCPNSAGMIRELRTAVDTLPKDEDVLNWFRQNYGVTIVVAPSTHGFEGTIWWVPPIVSIMVLLLVVLLIRKWRMRAATLPAVADLRGDPQLEAFRARARKETEL
jgi:cytochrome c-type biogenesis protein CcmH